MQVVYLTIDFRKHKWEGGESEVGKGEEALKDVLMSTLLLGATGVQILPPSHPEKQWRAGFRIVPPDDEEAGVLFPRMPIP